MDFPCEPLVTVLLFARNRPHYLDETLRSIETQTYCRWRLLLSDNSSDEVAARENARILDEFRVRNPAHAIAYVRRSGRLSVMEHFRTALSEVQTPFVAVHNDDDIWLPHHLQRSMDWLTAGDDHGMTASDAFIIDSEGRRTGSRLNWTRAPGEQDYDGWLTIWCSNAHSHFGNWPGFVLRTSIVQALPAVDNVLTDVFAAIWYIMQGYRIRGFDEPTYLYRRHMASVTGTNHLVIERHRLLVWLARHYLLPLTRRHGRFPLVALKSVLALALKYRAPLPA